MEIEAEKAAVADCLDQFWAAFARGDARAIAALYHPNANLVLGGEEVGIGRPAIEQQYTRILEVDPLRPGTTITHNRRIHLVRSDVAIIDLAARLTTTGAAGDPQPSAAVFFTIVAVKDEEGWRLAAVRGADSSNLSPPLT